MKDKRNPVAKFLNEFNKPKTFRDRKKHPSKKQQEAERAGRIEELHHPAHQPYKREHTNLTRCINYEDDYDDGSV